MYFGFENISVAYNRRDILRNLTLSVKRGSITTIVGRNGCGKSTLLRTISRAVRPISGDVILNNRPMSTFHRDEFARRVAYMPQTQIAPPDLDVRTLVSYGRFPLRVSRAADNAAVECALNSVGLIDLADRRIGTLSGGERQRALIAMQICREPEILVLDEPTTFLDIACQLVFMDIITSLRNAGMTILLVMHDLNLASRFSDRIAVVHNGNIHSEGRPTEVLTHETIREVFGISVDLFGDPPQFFPIAAN